MANWDEGLAVRCASCRRAVAWSAKPAVIRNEIFCSDWCRDEPPTTTMAARNDEWVILNKLGGVTPVAISRRYGVAHSLVYRTLKRLAY